MFSVSEEHTTQQNTLANFWEQILLSQLIKTIVSCYSISKPEQSDTEREPMQIECLYNQLNIIKL